MKQMNLKVIKRNIERQIFNPLKDRLSTYSVDTERGETLAECGACLSAATLFAAAPEMLEALKAYQSLSSSAGVFTSELRLEVLEKIDRAVAKAEGRE